MSFWRVAGLNYIQVTFVGKKGVRKGAISSSFLKKGLAIEWLQRIYYLLLIPTASTCGETWLLL